jgi:hypothetical protein
VSLTPCSIGLALTDTLDDLISDERINPQLAMKILANFDQAITEALQRNVKNRMSFKVGTRHMEAHAYSREAHMIGKERLGCAYNATTNMIRGVC